MIGYFKGIIQYSTPNKIILNVQNVGYEINYFNNFTLSDPGNELELYIVQKFSEYGVSLFGFLSVEEKLIFETLDNIKGIGSKSIFVIMSLLEIKTANDLQALKLDDLVGLPGIGKSTAQKFLLGLSAKLKKEFALDTENNLSINNKLEVKFKNEIDLLVEWGMKKADVINFLKENEELLEGKSSEQVIKIVLQRQRTINK